MPKLLEKLVLEEYTDFDLDNDMFTVTIPATYVYQYFDKNVPVDMIFYLFWRVADGDNEKKAYMNILYTVTVAQAVEV